MPPMTMVHETDPKDVLLNRLKGTIPEGSCMNNQVLVAIYDRPEKTKAGVLLTTTYRKEEKFQGKVCLIVMMGETAFIPDEDKKWFVSQRPQLHDWIVMRPSSGMQVSYGGVECRLINDTAVLMRVDHPDLIW